MTILSSTHRHGRWQTLRHEGDEHTDGKRDASCQRTISLRETDTKEHDGGDDCDSRDTVDKVVDLLGHGTNTFLLRSSQAGDLTKHSAVTRADDDTEGLTVDHHGTVESQVGGFQWVFMGVGRDTLLRL